MFHEDAPYPNCFGNLLTPQVVLTTLKCFIKVKAVREYYGLPQKHKIGLKEPRINLHLIFMILQFKISSLMNWFFSLGISNLIFTGYSRQKNLVQRLFNSIFQTGDLQKSSADT